MRWLIGQRRQLHDFYRGDFRRTLGCTAAAFGLLVLLSYVYCSQARDFITWLIEWFTQQVTEAGVVESDGTLRVGSLLRNNVQAMLLAIGYGFLPFVYLPALSLGINALLLGGFAAYYTANGVPLWFYAAGTLPHGLFELPALVLALAGGLHLCRQVTDTLRGRAQGVVAPLCRDLLRLLVLHILPLLLAAAVVEAHITPALLRALA